VRILLDENLPRKLVEALRSEGDVVESIITLRLQGLDNGRLYRLASREYDLCFTRDSGFVHNIRQTPTETNFKLILVKLAQKPQDQYVEDFLSHFRGANWDQVRHGDSWPA
jgi:predicted nuclease of predicted toxin-antitoxin system